MLPIPPPLPPGFALNWTWGLAISGIVLGPLLILWGRVLSRPFLALVAGVVGYILSPSLARQFGLDPNVAAVIASVSFAALGAITARLIWALAGGSLTAIIALWVLLAHCVPALPPKEQPAFVVPGSLELWLVAVWDYGIAGLQAIWAVHSERILWTLCLGGGIPLAILLLLPRFGKIFMTSLAGSLLLVGGFLIAATHMRNALWATQWSDYLLPGVIVLALLMFSLVFQYLGSVAAAKAKAAREKEQKDKAAKGGKKPEPPKK